MVRGGLAFMRRKSEKRNRVVSAIKNLRLYLNDIM